MNLQDLITQCLIKTNGQVDIVLNSVNVSDKFENHDWLYQITINSLDPEKASDPELAFGQGFSWDEAIEMAQLEKKGLI